MATRLCREQYQWVSCRFCSAINLVTCVDIEAEAKQGLFIITKITLGTAMTRNCTNLQPKCINMLTCCCWKVFRLSYCYFPQVCIPVLIVIQKRFLFLNTFHMSLVRCLGVSFCLTLTLTGLPSQLSLALVGYWGIIFPFWVFWECRVSFLSADLLLPF